MSRKKTDQLVSLAGAFEGVIVDLASRVERRGGSLARAIVALREPGRDQELDGLAEILSRVGMPTGKSEAFTPTYDPTTGIYRFRVNYDETIEEKLKRKDPATIGQATSYATDENFPDDRRGTEIVESQILFPGKVMDQGDLALASAFGPKVLIDFAQSFPRPALDGDMPLVTTGQSLRDADGNRYFLYLYRNGSERKLDIVGLYRGERWNSYWRFLVPAR